MVRVAHTVTRAQKGCRQLFILYQGQAGRMMMDPMEFLRATRIGDRNLIMIGDKSRRFYQRGLAPEIPDIPSFIAWQQKLIDSMPHVTDVMCVGSSSGAYAAIISGHLLKAREVWAFAPPTDLITACESQGVDPSVLDTRYSNLRELLKVSNGVTKYNVYYNESATVDRHAALYLEGCPGVELHSRGGEGHGVVLHMSKMGELDTLLPPFAPV
jgi:hypothetical protein